jgi:hypothetical protein
MNIYHIHSSDGGLTWSSPVQLAKLINPVDSGCISYIKEMVLDACAVWFTSDPPSFIGTAVFTPLA